MPKKTKVVDGKQAVYIRLDRSVVEHIKEQAEKEGRSFSSLAARILEQATRANAT